MTERWWHPSTFSRRRPWLHARAKIADAVRGYFRGRGFVEVETPALQVSPGLEPHLQAFATRLREPFGERQVPRYLHTSPEYAMKKLLAAGETRIFQLGHVFRNEARSPTHHPEFTMLEWYRAGAGWRAVAEDALGVLGVAAAAAGASELRWQERHATSTAGEWLSVQEAFLGHAGIDLLATAGDVARLSLAAQRVGVRPQPKDTWEDVFFRVLLDCIEAKLGSPAPTILHSYPAALAALARLDPDDPRVAERFELYVCGLELANGFGELTDAGEQRRRFEAEREAKQRLGFEVYPIDEDFLAALAAMPPAAGAALGFDRLVMVATGAPSVEDVLWSWVD
jgi:lysyl-tRNA synthetase class 2